MLLQASRGRSDSAHVVVLGNEKGGSGKSTTALHVPVALMKAGQRVATIDLDCRQRSFTHYIDLCARTKWSQAWTCRPLRRKLRIRPTHQVADERRTRVPRRVLLPLSSVSSQLPWQRYPSSIY